MSFMNMFTNISPIILRNIALRPAAHTIGLQQSYRWIQTSHSLNALLFKRYKKEEFFKKQDNLGPDYDLIYKAPWSILVGGVKHFTTFSFLSLTPPAIWKILKGNHLIDSDLTFAIGNMGEIASSGGELYGFLVGFVIFNTALRLCVNAYPLRFYQNGDKYAAIFVGLLPRTRKVIHFQKGELVENFKSLNPWAESTYKIKNTTVLLLPRYFRKPVLFYDMLKNRKDYIAER